jgi:pimeloyl-ACP methyl ester carboxylesterase
MTTGTTPLTESMMEIDGKQIALEDEGSGDAVLMVHGLGGTSNTWFAQTAMLARLFRVLRPDLEGSGRSPATGPLSIAGFARDMLRILDALKIDRAHLVGHSMGTMVCQALAAEHPDRVKSLALLGPIVALPEAGIKGVHDRAALARKDGMQPIANILVGVAISAASRTGNPAVAAFLRESVMRQDAEGYARTCEALAGGKAAHLASVRCRTLLITGDEDMVGPPRAVVDMSSKLGGPVEYHVLTGCGHWAPLEKAELVNNLLLRHLLAGTAA